MNDRFTTDELATLMAAPSGQAVSIYMPAHRVTTRTQADALQLKNLLKAAEDQLIQTGLRSPLIRDLLAPAHALLDHSDFWRNQSDGLALFLDADGLRRYRLPLDFAPQTIVAPRFHVKPLLPLFTNDGLFYILAVSQNAVRLLQGTRHTVDELDPTNVPNSLAEALKYDDPEKQLQFHTSATASVTGRRDAMFHGHGGGATEDDKDRILRYFQQIDRGLQEFLHDGHAPLVFAGVEYLLPIYRQANTYAHLTETGVEGNPDELRAADLHQRAWEIVAPIFTAAQDTALDRYHALAGTGRTGHAVADILPAAYHGRVDTAFVAVDEHEWGRFDPEAGAVTLDAAESPDNEDLYDLIAVYTWLRGGQVFAMPRAAVPADNAVAALYRF